MSWLHTAMLALGVGSTTNEVVAAMSYLSQAREIGVGGASVQHETLAAPDFGDFEATIVPFPGQSQYDAGAGGSQSSRLLLERVQAAGSALGYDGRQTSYGVGRSLMRVTFSVDEPTSYALFGSFSLGGAFASLGIEHSSMLVRLSSEATGNTLFVRSGAPNHVGGPPIFADTFSEGGVLQPGSYRYEIAMYAGLYWFGGSGGGDSGTYDITLIVPGSGAVPLLAGAGLIVNMRLRRRERSR